MYEINIEIIENNKPFGIIKSLNNFNEEILKSMIMSMSPNKKINIITGSAHIISPKGMERRRFSIKNNRIYFLERKIYEY